MELLSNNLDKFVDLGLLFAAGMYIRILLGVMGQSWIKTIAHTATITLLPIITYVITNVISGNIALSLGMVGALSIVRFRNPVRSPLELSVYFGAITMGIAAAVSLLWLFFLVGSVTVIAITLYLVSATSKLLTGTSIFITSFSEGNSLSTLNVTLSKVESALDSNESLISKITTSDEVSYTFASINFDELKKMEASVRLLPNVRSIQLNR
jgi:hypothetical protein